MTLHHSASHWETITCPVCDSDEFNRLFELAGEPFVQCRNCDLLLINPRPCFEQINATYSHDYSRGYADKADKKRRRARKRVKKMAKALTQPYGRWLDVGCSAGFIVEAAQQAGFEGWGSDVESWGIEYGRRVLGLEHLYAGALEAQHFPDEHFQVISLHDVIEHVPDLNSLVKELKRILAREGIIDIITPDLGHWRVDRPLKNWKELKPSEHLYYFTKTTLGRLLARHGLSIIKQRFSLKTSLKLTVSHQ